MKGLNLLTIKPVIYACNVADEDLAEGNAFVEAIKKRSGGESVVVVSAQVESELVSLDSEDRDEFLDALGVTLEGCGLRALGADGLRHARPDHVLHVGAHRKQGVDDSRGLARAAGRGRDPRRF